MLNWRIVSTCQSFLDGIVSAVTLSPSPPFTTVSTMVKIRAAISGGFLFQASNRQARQDDHNNDETPEKVEILITYHIPLLNKNKPIDTRKPRRRNLRGEGTIADEGYKGEC